MIRQIVLVPLLLFFMSCNTFADQDNRVDAYYFHTTFRCASCHKIEEYTGETMNGTFADAINSGNLQYKVINVEENGNEHYIKDYQLYTKAVVLSLVKDGKEIKSKNLEKVWQYLGNKGKFTDYVKTETESFLKELQ
ncbi:MAG: nitrophenyl compound nitroreductase subunit ArsF family protein [Candidatus Auribacterota bacterium]